eukprot:TRINITY_DN17715_c0_g1_i2.p1 TRINITY_DN17715_c0_g1~~TRINITY_DN17715_c0_g1_i2.p1  ORF type:complete len:296 (+),score=64.75 TRINITY_DN17715_c0_g1_i2:159-1046(+)
MKSDILLPSLLRLLGDKKEIEQTALETLVNLSQDSNLASKMVDIGLIDKVMERAGNGTLIINKLLGMLLVNLTLIDAGVEHILQTRDEKLQGLYLAKLVRLFSTTSNESEGNVDPFEHIGSVLVNISRTQTGRILLLDPKRSFLKQIIRQSDSTSILRRKGVSGTLRNCCFEVETQLPNFLVMAQFLWPALLLPLAGKQAYSEEDRRKMPLELASPLSHERETEKDPEIRIQAAESLYMIAIQKDGREALWSVNGARILEIGYQDEEDAQVMEAYERIGSLLISESCVSENRKGS